MKTFLIPSDFSTKNQEHVQLLQQAHHVRFQTNI